MKKNLPVLLTGVIVGIAALVLTAFGNPANMGFCIACFLRDIAGALKLHSAGIVQYVRPEIVGIIAGAAGAALIKKEWKAVGGSSPFTRFVLAICVMIGALVFLGCPLRMVIRIGGGDPEGKMSLLMDHTARPGSVADPWYTDDFEATWRDVLEGCRGLLAELSGGALPSSPFPLP